MSAAVLLVLAVLFLASIALGVLGSLLAALYFALDVV